MDLKVIEAACKALPANVSVMFRGPTGVGKSEFVGQLAQHFGIGEIDIRLGQKTEGDIIGLPDFETLSLRLAADNDPTPVKVTTWRPPVWYIKACASPMLIHFDELNRATREVLQGVFQVALDREMGFTGLKLHPDTRIYCSVNEGREYQVTPMDPALRNRFANFDFLPSHTEWFAHLRTLGPEYTTLVDFFTDGAGTKTSSQNTLYIERPVGAPFDANQQYPTRRSWTMAFTALIKAGIHEEPTHGAFAAILQSMVGPAAADAFQKFVKDNGKRALSADDILNDFAKHESRIKSMSMEQCQGMVDVIKGYVSKHPLDDAQARNLARAIRWMPGEIMTKAWLEIATGNNIAHVAKVHPFIVGYLLLAVGQGEAANKALGPDGESPAHWWSRNRPEAKLAAPTASFATAAE
jgi:hypothetical protein